MKKFLSLVLALVMAMSLVTVSAGAKDFDDSDKLSGERYEEAVNVMSEMGIIDGYADGTFQPQGTLTRGAAAKIIACMMLGKTTAEALGTQAAPFKDVPVGSTFAGYIAYCSESGIIDGYSDGTFRPGNTLTGFAFLKMLLTALGYDSEIEQYANNPNWTVNVAGRAKQIGLVDGNEDFVGTKAATREEACLYALNALQATLVEYTDKGANITIGDTTISTGASNATYVTSNVYDAATSINDSTDNVKNGWTVEFAEKYQPKLRLSQTTDEFERPSHTWSWDKKDIGTYLNYDELVAEYTTGVTGKEIYNLLTATTINECQFYSYLDGAKGNVKNTDLVRSNNKDLADTDDGVLTQVFVDRNDNEIVITSINTFLAKATANYSESKEYAPLTVYTAISADKKTVTEKSYNVDVEDVPAIADVEEDSFYQVTISKKEVADGEVITVADVETLSNSTVTKWSYDDEKVASKLTTGGTEYKAAAKAFYDAEELYAYDQSLLTDMTYNVYLDQYGYILGVDLYEGDLKYVFITGYDRPTSNLSVSTAKAAAIFLDGKMEEIEVNVKATNDNITESGKTYFGPNTDWTTEGKANDGNPMENRWYTYSINEKGVYTLKPADMTITKYVTANDATTYKQVTIDTANVSVLDNIAPAGKQERVYGEDASVYITVDNDVVDTTNGVARAITDVTGVYTGVQSVDLEIENKKEVVDILEHQAQVYTVYDKYNYIIGAVVVGDATGSTANIVYALGEAKSEEIKDGVYYWEFEVVMGGTIQTLTVKSKYDDVINSIKSDIKNDDGIVELRMDADGYVVKAVQVTDIYKFADAIGNTDITTRDVYYMDSDVAAKTGSGYALALTLQGNVMYITNGHSDRGLAIAKDAKAVVIQKENNKTVKSEYDSVSAAFTRIADAVPGTTNVLDYDGRIIAVLNSNGTAAWVVFDNDSALTTGSSSGVNPPVAGMITTEPRTTMSNNVIYVPMVNVPAANRASYVTSAAYNMMIANGYTGYPSITVGGQTGTVANAGTFFATDAKGSMTLLTVTYQDFVTLSVNGSVTEYVAYGTQPYTTDTMIQTAGKGVGTGYTADGGDTHTPYTNTNARLSTMTAAKEIETGYVAVPASVTPDVVGATNSVASMTATKSNGTDLAVKAGSSLTIEVTPTKAGSLSSDAKFTVTLDDPAAATVSAAQTMDQANLTAGGKTLTFTVSNIQDDISTITVTAVDYTAPTEHDITVSKTETNLCGLTVVDLKVSKDTILSDATDKSVVVTIILNGTVNAGSDDGISLVASAATGKAASNAFNWNPSDVAALGGVISASGTDGNDTLKFANGTILNNAVIRCVVTLSASDDAPIVITLDDYT